MSDVINEQEEFLIKQLMKMKQHQNLELPRLAIQNVDNQVGYHQ